MNNTTMKIKARSAKLADNNDSLLTKIEAAKLLKVSERTIEYWTSKGRITSYKLGVTVRYLKSELIASFVNIKV